MGNSYDFIGWKFSTMIFVSLYQFLYVFMIRWSSTRMFFIQHPPTTEKIIMYVKLLSKPPKSTGSWRVIAGPGDQLVGWEWRGHQSGRGEAEAHGGSQTKRRAKNEAAELWCFSCGKLWKDERTSGKMTTLFAFCCEEWNEWKFFKLMLSWTICIDY